MKKRKWSDGEEKDERGKGEDDVRTGGKYEKKRS
jgi:hypothetical protein